MSAAGQEWLDDIILDLVHQGSLLPRGKTINAGMFAEAKAAINAKFDEAVGLNSRCLGDGRCVIANELNGGHLETCPLGQINLERSKSAVKAWYGSQNKEDSNGADL